MNEWVKTVKEDELNELLSISVNRKNIVLIRFDNGIYALDNICSHEYALLSEGEVWDGSIYCPKHGSSFDIKDGSVNNLPATEPIASYRVKIEDGYIYLKERG